MNILNFIIWNKPIPTPDKEGYSYLYLFKPEYHKEICNKIGQYPMIKEVREFLQKCGNISVTMETYNKYFVDNYLIKRYVVHSDKAILLEPYNLLIKEENSILTMNLIEILDCNDELEGDYNKVNTASWSFVLSILKHSEYRFQ